MAVNPMQRQKRNSFLLGMVVTMLIAAIIIVILFLQITERDKKIESLQIQKTLVYVLNTEVKSGQALTEEMFQTKYVAITDIPAGSTTDVSATLNSQKLCATDGRRIYTKSDWKRDEKGEVELKQTSIDKNSTTRTLEIKNFYVISGDKECTIYTTEGEIAKSLVPGQNVYYLDENERRIEITVAQNVVVAKIDLPANTILTPSLITKGDEITTKDLRKVEYNVISLPIDLMTDEFVDIRLTLPNGEDYIVLTKKRVTVPMSNGSYLPDTIQMNLTESEILLLSGAIIDSYRVEGSKLYANKYVEAGIQESATMTYAPSNEVANLIITDPNAVNKAITNLRARIENAIMNYVDPNGSVESDVNKSAASSLEARKNYLNSLTK